jgi:hypothetical protein
VRLLELVKQHLEQRAAAVVPTRQALAITIRDVDLAGDFEPWRGPQFERVRVYRDTYPPRVSLTFTLTEGGRVVAEAAATSWTWTI